MTLEDLIPDLPLSYAQGTIYGLVFAIDVKMRLDEIQQEHPPVNYATPVATTDGRYVLHGDLLSEVGPNGMFGGTFSYLDQSRFNEVEVIDWSAAQALLPVIDPI